MKDLNTGDWKPRKDRSKKDCCCGGHNSKNWKANKHHNSTKQRLSHRVNGAFVRSQKIPPNAVPIGPPPDFEDLPF